MDQRLLRMRQRRAHVEIDFGLRPRMVQSRSIRSGEGSLGIFEERKIDCHAHVLDPRRFPYEADTPYRPSGQEIGNVDQFLQVMKAYGVEHALLVQPNSGYGRDNRCLLDALDRHRAMFRGVAIVDMDAGIATLRAMQKKGIVGIALNPTVNGNAHYADAPRLMAKLAELDMFVQLQVEHDLLLMYRPWIEAIPVRVLVDHCGRPSPAEGLDQPGFASLLALAATGRVHVKLSGYAKFSSAPWPFEDTFPFLRALVGSFGLDRCLWASDWPYLRAPDRQDYGPNLKLVELHFPDPTERRKLFWDTPKRLFGFAG